MTYLLLSAFIIYIAVIIYRDKVKRLSNKLERLWEENQELNNELNKHKMAIRRKRLQREAEKLKPYGDILLGKMDAMYPGFLFTFEVREDGDEPEPDTLYLIIRDKDGVKVNHDEFMTMREKAIDIAEQFPVEIDIGYGNVILSGQQSRD